jgi:muramoyltetrapeptide carboxypeptidase LdcA involved in peptidoglycan recycling
VVEFRSALGALGGLGGSPFAASRQPCRLTLGRGGIVLEAVNVHASDAGKPLVKPRKLRPGSRVAAISLSWGGPGVFPLRYEAGKRQFEDEFHVNVVETRHALKHPNWLSRHPEARAEDLMSAFLDPSIDAIISTIGGDDSIRILPYLDLDVIRKNSKVFMGFSDTTISLLVCFRAGLVSFYGPTFMAGFAENGGMFPYMVESVRKTLFSSDPVGTISPNAAGWAVEELDWGNPENQSRRRHLNPSTGWNFLQGKGVVEGRLIGGCVEVLDWLRGTEFWPSLPEWENAILFLETSEEAPPAGAVGRFVRCLAAMGVLSRLSGILFGRPGGQVPPENFAEYDEVLVDAVSQEYGRTDLPIVTGMDFGHTDPMMVLPMGMNARIDCDSRQFSILENAVVD